jgi:proteasome lid subunit RPN8/RPN11
MVIFKSDTFEAICNEGELIYPQECCGLLAGKKEADSFIVQWIVPMKNRVASAVLDRYLIDPKERSLAEEKIASNGMELVGFYHSHPDHDAYFSQTDLENSEEYQFGAPWLLPAYVYLVLSVKNGEAGDFAAFIINDGKAEKILVQPKFRDSGF